jgi:hypothetical protein
MAIYDIFSQRQAAKKPKEQDPLRYDLPEPLRQQICYILKDAIGYAVKRNPLGYRELTEGIKWWQQIVHAVKRERGLDRLSAAGNACDECLEAILGHDPEIALDLIDVAFRFIDKVARSRRGDWTFHGRTDPDDAIDELNHRFAQHGVGYRFEEGKLIKLDSEYLHSEVVKPALELLHAKGFEGPSEEFLKAHEHYRNGRFKEAITNACHSFESVMQAICDKRGWPLPSPPTAKPLIDTCIRHGLIPAELNSQLGALSKTLESLPSVGNKKGRHGQGPDVQNVETHYAAYALHLAATNIVFFVQAEKALV